MLPFPALIMVAKTARFLVVEALPLGWMEVAGSSGHLGCPWSEQDDCNSQKTEAGSCNVPAVRLNTLAGSEPEQGGDDIHAAICSIDESGGITADKCQKES